MYGVSLKTKIFIIIPLAVFGALIFGSAIYMEICKNSSFAIIDC
jgi:hypothetical protein